LGGNSPERLKWKEPFHSLLIELQEEFGLSPVAARALCRRIEEFGDSYYTSSGRTVGQIVYSAVAVGEKAGKPVKFCKTVPVSLTVLHPFDANILDRRGSVALRQVRLCRMASEAYMQGGLLSYEDLACLLSVDISTIRSLVNSSTGEGGCPPTRGLMQDIGRTLSHKEEAVRLYFRGVLPAEIAARTGHSLGSVERYLSDFARVMKLTQDSLPIEATCRLTGLSPKLVKTYKALWKKLQTPANKPVIEQLMRRFDPLETPNRKERRDGKRT